MMYYLGIGIAKSDPAAASQRTGPRRLLLERPISDFKTFVSHWDKVTPDMQVYVRDIKRQNLPIYIFPEDQRPRVPISRRGSVLDSAVTASPQISDTAPESELGKRSRSIN